MRTARHAVAALVGLCVLPQLSCGQEVQRTSPASSPYPAPVPATAKLTTLSNAGRYEVSWQPTEGAIMPREWFAIEVNVSDVARREPVPEDVALNVAGGMSAHGHGMNRVPVVTRTGPGRFLVEGLLFHMPGVWQLYFDLTRSGQTERAQFELEVL